MKDDHSYRFGVKVGDRLFWKVEPENRYSDKAIVVKLGNDDIVIHVPENTWEKIIQFYEEPTDRNYG